jgi:hypothetical protein
VILEMTMPEQNAFGLYADKMHEDVFVNCEEHDDGIRVREFDFTEGTGTERCLWIPEPDLLLEALLKAHFGTKSAYSDLLTFIQKHDVPHITEAPRADKDTASGS